MSYDNDANPTEELYRSFLKSLSQPESERYFDEDELVEIFDYAGDMDDDYARAEVLFCGTRLYPDSMALKERRAMFYFDLDNGSAPAYVADTPMASSMLFDIVRLEANRPGNPAEALSFLANQYDKFTDEETIRLVDLAIDLDQYSWVIDNIDMLRKKTEYLPSLLYEVMTEADDRGDDERTIALAEELIEIEPFAIAYWATLFRAQARSGRQDDARQTFDTARALGADDPAALLNLADVIYSYAPYLQNEAIEMVGQLKAQDPDQFTFADCYCAFLVQAGRNSAAIAEMRDFVDAHPTDLRALKQLLQCNVADATELCCRYFAESGTTEMPQPLFDEIVNILTMRSAMTSLAGLMAAISMVRKLDASETAWYAEALFAMGRFEEVVELASAHDDVFEQIQIIPFRGPSYVYACVVSYMKTGHGEQADAMLARALPAMEAFMPGAPMPIRMASRTIITLADKVRRHPADDTLYWERFDMLGHFKFS